MFQFDVPAATYSKMFLFITASEGAAKLAITLNYSGGGAPTTLTLMLPDYGIGGAGANDPVFFNLIAGMRKWGTNDNEGDSTTHTITGIELNPTATAMLTSIKVEKMNGSHCVFWGATGIATSAVTSTTGTGGSGGTAGQGGQGGQGGSTGATDGGATDASGAAGAGGTPGTSGAAGATGTTGTAGSTSTGAAGSAARRRAHAGSTTGAAGATSTGTAGATGTTGAAGTTAPKRSSGGGGCSVASASTRDEAACLMLAVALGLVIVRRRR